MLSMSEPLHLKVYKSVKEDSCNGIYICLLVPNSAVDMVSCNNDNHVSISYVNTSISYFGLLMIFYKFELNK